MTRFRNALSMPRLSLISSVFLATTCAFVIHRVPSSPPTTNRGGRDVGRSSSRFLVSPETATDPESARGLFYLWFFGGSGGGGIALSAFPKMYDRYQRKVRDLKTKTDGAPTREGEPLGLPATPLVFGYPEQPRVDDVRAVLVKRATVERMVADGPKENMWAARGYLQFEAFSRSAGAGADPVAVRAVFDAISGASFTVEPDVAQERLDRFRDGDDGLEALKQQLVLGTLKGWSAIAATLFLLGIAGGVCVESLAQGWFPDWPGNDNFPVGLVDPGVWTIPQYWI